MFKEIQPPKRKLNTGTSIHTRGYTMLTTLNSTLALKPVTFSQIHPSRRPLYICATCVSGAWTLSQSKDAALAAL